MAQGERSAAEAITAGRAVMLNRQIKDTVFSDLFGDKTRLLALYRALHPEDTEATEDDIANVTMKNILMVDLYNDLGFTVRDRLLLLVEAQSTWTVNVVFRLFLYLAETWGEYVKASEQNIYGTKKIVLPKTECYVVFTGDRKDKPSVISLFDEFLAPLERGLVSVERGCQRAKHAADECTIELKARVIFASEGDGGMDILQQYIAFSRELDAQFKDKGRTMEALTAAIERCKQNNILRDYLATKEKEVAKIMTVLFDQGYVNEIAGKEREAIGEARGVVIGVAKGREEGKIEGVFKTLYELVKDNLLSLANAARKAGQSEEEFAAGMESYFLHTGGAS